VTKPAPESKEEDTETAKTTLQDALRKQQDLLQAFKSLPL
jgi:hypothetical protein